MRGSSPVDMISGRERWLARSTMQLEGRKRTKGIDVPRVIGVRDGGRPGPLVLVVAGQHGNEPGGIHGTYEVLDGLDAADVHGRVVFLGGHLEALRQGERHLGRDLNRIWTDEDLAAATPDSYDADLRELAGLHAAIADELAAAGGRHVVLVDLHSTSAGGGGFSVVADSIPSRLLARSLPLPAILGLEERLDGPLLSWMCDRGHAAVVVEGGQHEDPVTARVCAGGVWLALAHCGAVDRRHPRVAPARALLERVSHGLPGVMDLSYVHAIPAGATFVMEPGWKNFARVPRDQPLALQDGEIVQAPLEGFMLMPLYQGLGSEGFFLCRKVSLAWLTASRWARRSGLERLLRLWPGVRRVTPGEGVATTCRRPGRWTVALLHLFGYRKHEPTEADAMLWHRRHQRK